MNAATKVKFTAVFAVIIMLAANMVVMAAYPYEADADPEAKPLVYVSLGDSMVNGYGMPDYYVEGQYGGFLNSVEDTYPYMLADYLVDEGYKVDFRQMAVCGLRSLDLRFLMDSNFGGDAVTPTIIDNNLAGPLAKLKIELGDDSLTIEDLRKYYADSVAAADLITYDFHYDLAKSILNTFEDINNGRVANYDYTAFYKEGLSEFYSADSMDMLNSARDFVKGHLSKILNKYGFEPTSSEIETMAEEIIYGMVSYCNSFDRNVEYILTANPKAKILVMDAYSIHTDVDVSYKGVKFSLNDMEDAIMGFCTAYTKYLSPYSLMVYHVDVDNSPRLFYSTALKEPDLDQMSAILMHLIFEDADSLPVNESVYKFPVDKYPAYIDADAVDLYDELDKGGKLTDLLSYVFYPLVADYQYFYEGGVYIGDAPIFDMRKAIGMIYAGAEVEYADDGSVRITLGQEQPLVLSVDEIHAIAVLLMMGKSGLIVHVDEHGHSMLYEAAVESLEAAVEQIEEYPYYPAFLGVKGSAVVKNTVESILTALKTDSGISIEKFLQSKMTGLETNWKEDVADKAATYLDEVEDELKSLYDSWDDMKKAYDDGTYQSKYPEKVGIIDILASVSFSEDLRDAIDSLIANWDSIAAGVDYALESMLSAVKYINENWEAIMSGSLFADSYHDFFGKLSNMMDGLEIGERMASMQERIADLAGGMRDISKEQIAEKIEEYIEDLGDLYDRYVPDKDTKIYIMIQSLQKILEDILEGLEETEGANFDGETVKLDLAILSRTMQVQMLDYYKQLISEIDYYVKELNTQVKAGISKQGISQGLKGALENVSGFLTGLDSQLENYAETLDAAPMIASLIEKMGDAIDALDDVGDMDDIKSMISEAYETVAAKYDSVKDKLTDDTREVVSGYMEDLKDLNESIKNSEPVTAEQIKEVLKGLQDAMEGYDWDSIVGSLEDIPSMIKERAMEAVTAGLTDISNALGTVLESFSAEMYSSYLTTMVSLYSRMVYYIADTLETFLDDPSLYLEYNKIRQNLTDAAAKSEITLNDLKEVVDEAKAGVDELRQAVGEERALYYESMGEVSDSLAELSSGITATSDIAEVKDAMDMIAYYIESPADAVVILLSDMSTMLEREVKKIREGFKEKDEDGNVTDKDKKFTKGIQKSLEPLLKSMSDLGADLDGLSEKLRAGEDVTFDVKIDFILGSEELGLNALKNRWMAFYDMLKASYTDGIRAGLSEDLSVRMDALMPEMAALDAGLDGYADADAFRTAMNDVLDDPRKATINEYIGVLMKDSLVNALHSSFLKAKLKVQSFQDYVGSGDFEANLQSMLSEMAGSMEAVKAEIDSYLEDPEGYLEALPDTAKAEMKAALEDVSEWLSSKSAELKNVSDAEITKVIDKVKSLLAKAEDAKKAVDDFVADPSSSSADIIKALNKSIESTENAIKGIKEATKDHRVVVKILAPMLQDLQDAADSMKETVTKLENGTFFVVDTTPLVESITDGIPLEELKKEIAGIYDALEKRWNSVKDSLSDDDKADVDAVLAEIKALKDKEHADVAELKADLKSLLDKYESKALAALKDCYSALSSEMGKGLKIVKDYLSSSAKKDIRNMLNTTSGWLKTASEGVKNLPTDVKMDSIPSIIEIDLSGMLDNVSQKDIKNYLANAKSYMSEYLESAWTQADLDGSIYNALQAVAGVLDRLADLDSTTITVPFDELKSKIAAEKLREITISPRAAIEKVDGILTSANNKWSDESSGSIVMLGLLYTQSAANKKIANMTADMKALTESGRFNKLVANIEAALTEFEAEGSPEVAEEMEELLRYARAAALAASDKINDIKVIMDSLSEVYDELVDYPIIDLPAEIQELKDKIRNIPDADPEAIKEVLQEFADKCAAHIKEQLDGIASKVSNGELTKFFSNEMLKAAIGAYSSLENSMEGYMMFANAIHEDNKAADSFVESLYTIVEYFASDPTSSMAMTAEYLMDHKVQVKGALVTLLVDVSDFLVNAKAAVDPVIESMKGEVEYTIIWQDGDTVLGLSQCGYGEKPVYDGTKPTKASTDTYVYSLAGWSTDPSAKNVDGPEAAYEDAIYYAVFERHNKATGEPIPSSSSKTNPDGSVTKTSTKNGVTTSTTAYKDGSSVEVTKSTKNGVITEVKVSKDASGKVIGTMETQTSQSGSTSSGNYSSTESVTVKDASGNVVSVTEKIIAQSGDVNSDSYSRTESSVVKDASGKVITSVITSETRTVWDGVETTIQQKVVEVNGDITTEREVVKETEDNILTHQSTTTEKSGARTTVEHLEVASKDGSIVTESDDGEKTMITTVSDGGLTSNVVETILEQMDLADGLGDVTGQTTLVLESDYVTVRSTDLTKLSEEFDSIVVGGSDASVTLTSDIMKGLSAIGDNIDMSVSEASPSDMTEAQKQVVGDSFALVLDLSVDGTSVHNLGGKAVVTFEYVPTADQAGKELKVFYVDENGNKEMIESSFENNVMTMGPTHFSLFFVDVVEEDAPVAADSDNTLLYVAVLAAILVIILVVVFLVARKKNVSSV